MTSLLNISDIAQKVQDGELDPVENIKETFGRLQEAREFRAIINTIDERSLQRASHIKQLVKKGGEVGRLAGVPFIAKDNFLTLGVQTTAASLMLQDFKAPYQATAVEKLEAEGAICIAKSNMDAWAHGSSTENSDFFVTKNPHDQTRVPGGSSGGSAATVALGIVPFAIGTDTGGSIRLPASFSGTVGLKPTYGLVSRSGVIAMASSTDVIGPLTNSVEDAALILDIMAGQDPLDSTTIETDPARYVDLTSSKKLKRIGVIKEFMNEGLEPGVRKTVQNIIDKLKAAGYVAEEVSLPTLPLALAVYYIICPAEVSSNLARYDGQRYGLKARGAKDLLDSYELSRAHGFGAEAKRRIIIGTYVLSSGYYDAYYQKAQTVRTKIINELRDTFKKYDFLVGPTSPTTAFKIGERSRDPLSMYLTDIMTVAANISGNPAISVPVAMAKGLPVGFQIIAPMRHDRQMLCFAKEIEELN
jgi:aspartyl-tRNA(Asn)/glutamyl-tRNA(Gln) amidotransferase subunit A